VKDQVKCAALSYLRAAATAVAAMYMSGVTDPKLLANCFIAAIIAPVLKGVDPNAKDYGIKGKDKA
jgi:hypothetical protein